MKNTDTETQIEAIRSDLDGFRPAPPERRIDDKAAVLEAEVQSLKLRMSQERFIYVFISTTLFVLLLAPKLEGWVWQFGLVVASVIFLLGIGKFFDFPWITNHLERWHDLFFRCAERWSGGKPPVQEMEPPPQS